LGFELDTEALSEPIGLFLSGAESVWTAFDGGVDVFGESAEVSGIDRRGKFDLQLFFLTAFCSSWGLLVVVVVIWLAWTGFDGPDWICGVTICTTRPWWMCVEDNSAMTEA
jgi:hypothetical protein